jgi:L-fuconolactonase
MRYSFDLDMRIDAHHHLWRYTPEDYGWISDAMQTLRRNFLPADLARVTAEARIDTTVAVQARQTLEETHWLLELATQPGPIRGVVGWAPIVADDFPAVLEALAAEPILKGLRHVIQAEPEGFMDAAAFNRGLSTLTQTGLVYDLLVVAHQLPEAIRLVSRHPKLTFVLDHIAKPDIRKHGLDPWRVDILELARRPNVVCKLSGMVTEADYNTWTPSQLSPYFETVLEAFTPSRLMMGSDWPVCTVACEYKAWFDLVGQWIAPLTRSEQAQIEGETAHRIYNLV